MRLGTSGTRRGIGRRLTSLLRAGPAYVPRHGRPSSPLPVDVHTGPCAGCGRPSLVAVTLFGDVDAPHCAARWPAVAARIEARGDHLSYTPAARSVLVARHDESGRPPRTREPAPEAPSRTAHDPGPARVRPYPPASRPERKPMSLATAALASAEPPRSMYWRRAFRGEPAQVAVARLFVACLLAGFRSLDEVLLAFDELAVNAIRHTGSGRPGGRFTVAVHYDAAGVTVSVTDEGACTEPRVQPLADTNDLTDLAEGGRGLFTVASLATAWCWTGTPCSRTVYATFALAREPFSACDVIRPGKP